MLHTFCLSLFVLGMCHGAPLPPGNLILGYPGDGCGPAIIRAAEDGVNVVIWDFLNLEIENGTAVMKPTGNMSCVAHIAEELRRRNLPTTHLISIGGWNAPHPSSALSGEEYFEAFHKWNTEVVATGGFAGFAGIDWDLEGNNDKKSPYNKFPVAVLDVVGTMSVAAKKAGYLVTLVPPQSYFDASTSEYNLSLLNPPHDPWQSGFLYQGRNCYAYLVAKYGIDTFDLVQVQIYESYSHANYEISMKGRSASEYIEKWATDVQDGWTVQFASDGPSGLPSQTIKVPRSRLVLGLANGWAVSTNGKVVYVSGEECGKAQAALKAKGKDIRGFMFWDISDEGKNGVHMARDLNAFLHVRG